MMYSISYCYKKGGYHDSVNFAKNQFHDPHFHAPIKNGLSAQSKALSGLYQASPHAARREEDEAARDRAGSLQIRYTDGAMLSNRQFVIQLLWALAWLQLGGGVLVGGLFRA